MGQIKGSKWLDAIERILLDANCPMEADAIARSAISQGLMRSNALLPGESVRNAIHKHITKEFNSRGFVVTGDMNSRRYAIERNRFNSAGYVSNRSLESIPGTASPSDRAPILVRTTGRRAAD